MANATTKLLVAGLLVVLPVSAGDPKRGQAHAVPDVMVYVESEQLSPSALLPAEGTATRMFAGIGVRVQWASRRPRGRPEPASGGCAPKRPRKSWSGWLPDVPRPPAATPLPTLFPTRVTACASRCFMPSCAKRSVPGPA